MYKTTSLCDLLRADHVKRWHIVENTHTQSVAEHSWNVAIIAQRLVSRVLANDEIGLKSSYGSNIQSTFAATNYALYHDIGEVLVGDTPTPVKQFIKTITGFNPFDFMVDGCCEQYDYAHSMVMGEDGMVWEGYMVKVADILDALAYVYKHIPDTSYKNSMLVQLETQVEDMKAEIAKTFDVSEVYVHSIINAVWLEIQTQSVVCGTQLLDNAKDRYDAQIKENDQETTQGELDV